jgi:lactoylglutathione lyase
MDYLPIMTNIGNQLAINHIQHLGIPVSDIRKSAQFYEKLGFSNKMEANFEMENKTGTCIMMLRGTIILELYQLPEHQLAAIRNRKDGHIDHIAFDVTDIDQTFNLVKAAGFAVIEPAPVFLQFWNKGCKYFNITGPDGERLEFNQIL